MKRLLILVMSVILSANLFADVTTHEVQSLEDAKQILIDKNIDPSVLDQFKSEKKDKDNFMEFSDRFNTYMQFNTYGKNTPFVYEPHSGYLFLADFTYFNNVESQLSVYQSSNMGDEWDRVQFYIEENIAPTRPSLAVLNPNKSNNPEDFYYFVYAFKYFLDANAEVAERGILVIKTPDITVDQAYIGPQSNNPGSELQWFQTQIIGDHHSGQFAYMWGGVEPVETSNAPLGNYGFIGFDFNNIDFTNNGIPEKFQRDQFNQLGSLDGSYNGQLHIDVDENGNLYAMFNNFFKGSERRKFGFSKSTDRGATWSDYNIIPDDVLDDFIYAQGGNPESELVLQPGSLPYQQNAIAVYGEDQFSYVLRLNVDDGNQPYPDYPMFAEVKYDNGTWSIHKIGDWSAGTPEVILTYTDDNDVEHNLATSNTRGTEIQLAKTMDGKLILKYLDYNEEFGPQGLDKNYEIYYYVRQPDDSYEYQPINVDTVYTTDIYYYYKDINSDNWEGPVNATNDITYNKLSLMPNLVPSITEVPTIYSQSQVENDELRNNIHPLLQQRTTAGYGMYWYDNVNLVTGSVADQVQDVTNSVVYPNPSSDRVNIKYNLDEPNRVAIRLYDVNGNFLTTLQNNQLGAGEHEVSFKVSHLPSGTYIYRIDIGNTNETGKFQVSK